MRVQFSYFDYDGAKIRDIALARCHIRWEKLPEAGCKTKQIKSLMKSILKLHDWPREDPRAAKVWSILPSTTFPLESDPKYFKTAESKVC